MDNYALEAARQISEVVSEYHKGLPAEYVETRMLAALTRFSPKGSIYRVQASHYVSSTGVPSERRRRLAGVLEALRADYETGAFGEIEARVRLEVLDDLLDIAERLVEEQPRSSVVLTGGILEEHIVKLAQAHGIELEQDGKRKRTQQLNDELAKIGVYTRTEQKQLTWAIGLRNDANHVFSKDIKAADAELLIAATRAIVKDHSA